MFEIGELVQYGTSGICRIEDIVQGVAGMPKEVRFYLMVPVNNRNGKIYSPIDNEKVKMRRIMTTQEVNELMETAPQITEFSISNEKQCEEIYKEALYSIDCYRWMKLLKTLYARKALRNAQGKKCTATDERYLKNVQERLWDELSLVLGEEEAKSGMDHALEGYAKFER